jgi:hypothetical protein
MKSSFEKIAANIAEQIDSAHDTRRPRARRLELIAHAVRRAIHVGYREGKNRNETQHAQTKPEANGQANAQAASQIEIGNLLDPETDGLK